MKGIAQLIISLMVMISVGKECHAQSQEKVYSLMLLNFARGIHWPQIPSDYFVVGVIEYPPLVPELEKTTLNSNIHGRKIKIVSIKNLKDVANCQIVFLPAYKAKLLAQVVETVARHPTLIVTNKTDMTKKGSGIDLVLREGKMAFDINASAIEQRGLKISANIRNTGQIVQ